jgi:hypothetical protein
MKTFKRVLSRVTIYIIRLLYSLINRDFVRPMKLTREEELYSYLEENKKRLQYLMYQKNTSAIVDIKTMKEIEKYNEELKEALNLTGNQYIYRRPLWVSGKMKKFLKNDIDYKEDAYKKSMADIEEMEVAFQELQERLRNKKIKPD